MRLERGADLADLIAWGATFSCKRFVYPTSLADRDLPAPLVSTSAVSVFDGWLMLLAALRAMGLTLAPAGDLLEVVELSQAAGAGGDGAHVRRPPLTPRVRRRPPGAFGLLGAALDPPRDLAELFARPGRGRDR